MNTSNKNVRSSNYSSNGITLDKEELQQLNQLYIQAGIKWLAMLKGMWASVAEVKDGLLVLEIIYPTKNKSKKDPELFVRILTHCRAFTFMDQIHTVFIIEYESEGSAGSFHTGELSHEERDQRTKESADFGKTKKHIGDQLLGKDDILRLSNPNG